MSSQIEAWVSAYSLTSALESIMPLTPKRDEIFLEARDKDLWVYCYGSDLNGAPSCAAMLRIDMGSLTLFPRESPTYDPDWNPHLPGTVLPVATGVMRISTSQAKAIIAIFSKIEGYVRIKGQGSSFAIRGLDEGTSHLAFRVWPINFPSLHVPSALAEFVTKAEGPFLSGKVDEDCVKLIGKALARRSNMQLISFHEAQRCLVMGNDFLAVIPDLVMFRSEMIEVAPPKHWERLGTVQSKTGINGLETLEPLDVSNSEPALPGLEPESPIHYWIHEYNPPQATDADV